MRWKKPVAVKTKSASVQWKKNAAGLKKIVGLVKIARVKLKKSRPLQPPSRRKQQLSQLLKKSSQQPLQLQLRKIAVVVEKPQAMSVASVQHLRVVSHSHQQRHVVQMRQSQHVIIAVAMTAASRVS